jgi:hypothetical protein
LIGVVAVDRRKRILVNKYEEIVHTTLKAVTAQFNAKVYPKVRVADALEIKSSGLTNDEYSYALKAHFDFVIVREDETAIFAVEFDGSQHETDADAIRRDRLKNSICNKLKMPILRITQGYLAQLGPLSILSWIIELWFSYEAFCEAEKRGELSWDADWHYGMFLPWRIQGPDLKYEPDPFLVSHQVLHKCYRDGICLQILPEYLFAGDFVNNSACVALTDLAAGGTIIGHGRCQCLYFPISASDLAMEIATADTVVKITLFQKGKFTPASFEEVQQQRERMMKLDRTLNNS